MIPAVGGPADGSMLPADRPGEEPGICHVIALEEAMGFPAKVSPIPSSWAEKLPHPIHIYRRVFRVLHESDGMLLGDETESVFEYRGMR